MKTFEDTGKPMKSVLPKKADWLKTSVEKFDPDNCKVTTQEGDEISYEYLVIAIGLQLKYEMVQLAFLKNGTKSLPKLTSENLKN